MCTSVSALCRTTLSNHYSSSLTLFAKNNIPRFGQNKKYLWSHIKNHVKINTQITFKRLGRAVISSDAIPRPLTKQQTKELVVRLTPDERQILMKALQESQSQNLKAEYEGQLAAFQWRSKFGRPSKVPTLGEVDPTGSYCKVPDDWLLRKYVESVPLPSKRDLFLFGISNAIPFVGFGFLDNAIMIIAGDSIEALLGSCITLSTMAAAALGNLFSDVMGIGSAVYVEKFAQKIGFEAPKLTPIQLDLPRSRKVANTGRVIGVIIGCLLGMTPLYFLNNHKKEEKDKKNKDDEK